MPDGHDMDHVSFAVHDARAAGAWARRVLGATPVFGEVLPDFRYLLMHVGTAAGGGRIEFMEPVAAEGFLGRFVARHGERPHHLTLTVPDLVDTVARVRAAGFTVVGEDLKHPPWREAFVMPDAVHGVVVQLAQTDRAFPEPADLVGSRERRPDDFPSNRGAEQPDWWTAVWDEPAGPASTLVETVLRSRDLGRSATLFGDILGGQSSTLAGESRFTWSRSALVVQDRDVAGVAGLRLRGSLPSGTTIAGIPLEGQETL